MKSINDLVTENRNFVLDCCKLIQSMKTSDEFKLIVKNMMDSDKFSINEIDNLSSALMKKINEKLGENLNQEYINSFTGVNLDQIVNKIVGVFTSMSKTIYISIKETRTDDNNE